MTEVSEDVRHRKFQFRAAWVTNFEYVAMASVTSAMRRTHRGGEAGREGQTLAHRHMSLVHTGSFFLCRNSAFSIVQELNPRPPDWLTTPLYLLSHTHGQRGERRR